MKNGVAYKNQNEEIQFLTMGLNLLKAKATSRRQVTFYYEVLRNPWYSFYRSRMVERLSRP